jgi:superfamily II DNA helicase RecQ
MLGTDASFRNGQWEAIESIVIKKRRTLVVQRTGWGKSVIYFIASKLFRNQGLVRIPEHPDSIPELSGHLSISYI